MAQLVINNLGESKELDRTAMKAISGGFDVGKVPTGSGVSPIAYPTIGGGGTKSTGAPSAIGAKKTPTKGYDDGGIVDNMNAAFSLSAFEVKVEGSPNKQYLPVI